MIDKEWLLEDKLIFLIELDKLVLLRACGTEQFCFHEYDLLAGVIYNPTKIANFIKAHLKKKGLSKLPGLVIFSDKLVQAHLIPKVDSFSDLSSYMHVKSILNHKWHYVATLKPGILLQYQLLFRKIGIYIELFTCEMILNIKYLQDHANSNLASIDSLDQLQLISPSDLDLYHRLAQAIGKI